MEAIGRELRPGDNVPFLLGARVRAAALNPDRAAAFAAAVALAGKARGAAPAEVVSLQARAEGALAMRPHDVSEAEFASHHWAYLIEVTPGLFRCFAEANRLAAARLS